MKREFDVPAVTLTDKDLAWIAERLVDVDNLYSHFQLTQAEWKVIEKNNYRDYDGVKRDMLLRWRRKTGSRATLHSLVSALMAPETVDINLIEEITQHFVDKSKCMDYLLRHIWSFYHYPD